MTYGGSDIYWCQCNWNTKCKVWWYVYQMLIALINYKCPTSFDSCIKKLSKWFVIVLFRTYLLWFYVFIWRTLTIHYIIYTFISLFPSVLLSFRPSVIPSLSPLCHSLPLIPLSFPPSYSSYHYVMSLSFLSYYPPLLTWPNILYINHLFVLSKVTGMS